MKAITIQQPWAQLCVLGFKRFETRSWPTDYRGTLAIHAGQGLSMVGGKSGMLDCLAFSELPEDHFFALRLEDYVTHYDDGTAEVDLPRGCVIGTVEVVRCERRPLVEPELDAEQYSFMACDKDWWAWELANPVLFDTPVPAKGGLGLWEWVSDHAAAA